jgi:hypothetical protein
MEGSFLSTSKGAIGLATLSLAVGIGVSAALLAGGMAGTVAVVATIVAALVGITFLAVARSEWSIEVARRASARRDELLQRHHRDLTEHAKWMMTQLQNEATPFLAGEVESQFKRHFPNLNSWVASWWSSIYTVQRNPRLGPRMSAAQFPAEQGLRSVMRGNVAGTCERCDEIALELSLGARRSRLRSIRDQLLQRPSLGSGDKG